MKVGDLIGVGWSQKLKQPFVAVIKKVHCLNDNFNDFLGYTVFIPATGKETFITQRDVQELSDDKSR